MNVSMLTPSNLRKGPHGPGRLIAYIGPSMNPTFRSGDLLQVIPYQGRKIQCGDVIAFLSPGERQRIIHRVTSVNSNGITTRGDNSNQIDPWVFTSAHVEGRVAYARRGNRGWEVAGGSMGRFSAGLVRAIRLLNSGISVFLRPAYHWMARTGILRQLLYPVITTRIVSFNRPEGREFQLLLGRLVIGWLPPAGTTWRIRRPFRLFVRESSLPQSPKQPCPGSRGQM